MQGLFSRRNARLIAASICCVTSLGALAQGTVNNANRRAVEPRGVEQQPDDRKATPLTAEQVAKVKAVLAAYTPTALKADDAKAIKRALRDAGLAHNAALDKAIAEAGFSPQKLEALDPRPARTPGPPAAQGNAPPTALLPPPPPPPPPPPGRPADASPRKP